MTYTDLIYPPSTDGPQHFRCMSATMEKNLQSWLQVHLIKHVPYLHSTASVQDSYRPSAALQTSHVY